MLRLSRVRHLALDLDGTVYKDGVPFPETVPFLALLERLGIGRTFLTNNSSRSTREHAGILRRAGIAAEPSAIHSSTVAAVDCLREEMPGVRRLFVLGTESLRRELGEAGFSAAGEAPRDLPDAVLVGFDTGLSYERLCRAAYWIARGLPYIATHPDRVCPTGEETVLVDCGSICAALEAATGRKPDRVAGKPSRRLLDGILRRHGLEAGELAMVGDRLYTDVAMARAAGVLAVLVLTGEATAAEAARSPEPPDLVVEDLAALGRALEEARGVAS